MIDGVTIEVLEDWDAGCLPPSKGDVEVVVPPRAYAEDFNAVVTQLPRLRVVQTLSAGVEQYRDAIPPGVKLYNASGVHVAATAEWVLAAVLACERNLLLFDDQRRAGVWAPRPSRGLADAQVVIVGAGEIGTAVGVLLLPFGAEVTYVARRSRQGVVGIDDIDRLLPQADVVILLVPHTTETHGLVDGEFLSRMKTGALLVNAARGPIVDSDALLAEVAGGRIRAALDVFDPEPPGPRSAIWSVPGTLLTPHVASNVAGMLSRQLALLATRLPAFGRSSEIPGARDLAL